MDGLDINAVNFNCPAFNLHHSYGGRGRETRAGHRGRVDSPEEGLQQGTLASTRPANNTNLTYNSQTKSDS